ncbi:hypothetical protein CAFE_17780 [Caprobacter fermentans]|uniref:Uncharacterized protein n=2 Tax=Caproicibacter fermentans TaxID=2576756 RepID=A0A6N8HZ40_9FIRM|nr:hypothetical protein [Caproicibacter fermentans]
MLKMNASPQTASSLKLIQKWLSDHIAADGMQLKQSQKDNKIGNYVLAAPAVHIGLVPPNGVVDPAAGLRVPCLVIGAAESDSDAEETRITLQITAIVYDPGTQDGPASLVPNFDGYLTLINLLDRVREWVMKEDGAAGCFSLEGGVKLTPYEEQPWPYWYGFLTFTVSGEPYPVTKYADVLR